MENSTAVGFIDITFFDDNGKKLGFESMQFDYLYSYDDYEEICVPKTTTSISVSLSIGTDDLPLPSGIAKLIFLNAKGKKIRSECLEFFVSSDTDKDINVPKKTRFVRIFCSIY